jgi:hypothetical protein
LISAYVLHGFKVVMDGAATKLLTSITTIALVVEMMYVTHYGYLILLQKSTEAVPNPGINDLLYHCVIVIVVLSMLKSGLDLTTLLLAFRGMVIEGFTGDTMPGGQQVAKSLGQMDAAFGVSNMIQAYSYSDTSPTLKNTAIALAVVAEIAPQLVGGVMLMFNELMVRLGMALLPLVVYCLLYKSTKQFFATWFNMMFSASLQMGVLAVTVAISVKITVIFLGLFNAFLIAQGLTSGVGLYVVSELQESLIHASLGMTLTSLMVWVPANAAAFAGTILTGGLTKSGIGSAVTQRAATERTAVKKSTVDTVRQAQQQQNSRTVALRAVTVRQASFDTTAKTLAKERAEAEQLKAAGLLAA